MQRSESSEKLKRANINRKKLIDRSYSKQVKKGESYQNSTYNNYGLTDTYKRKD